MYSCLPTQHSASHPQKLQRLLSKNIKPTLFVFKRKHICWIRTKTYWKCLRLGRNTLNTTTFVQSSIHLLSNEAQSVFSLVCWGTVVNSQLEQLCKKASREAGDWDRLQKSLSEFPETAAESCKHPLLYQLLYSLEVCIKIIGGWAVERWKKYEFYNYRCLQ